MTGAMIGTAIVFFPAAPLFLFMHGKDITIPKGTEITAYINGDIPLDPARFKPQAKTGADQPANPIPGPEATVSSVDLKSTPDGAEITVDDKYMGSTPSALKLSPGDHKIKLEKSGFKVWERTLSVSPGGSTNINATLDKE
jgi:PEGA domain